MKAVIKKAPEQSVSKDIAKLIHEAEQTIKKIDKKNPFEEADNDRRERHAIGKNPLEYCVGKITISNGCSEALIKKLSESNMSPHNFIQKDW